MATYGGALVLAASNGWVLGGATSNDLLVFTGNSNQSVLIGCSNNSNIYLAITSNAFVGVGLSNPGFRMDVAGDLNFSGTLRQGGVPYVGSQWSNVSSNVFLIGSNVGIGVSNAAAALHVGSNLRVDGAVQVYNALQFTGVEFLPGLVQNNYTQLVAATSNIQGYSNLLWGASGSNGTQYSIMSNSSNDVFQWVSGAASNEIMRLNGAGMLGLGRSNPSAMLDVNGNINFSSNLLNNNATYIGPLGSSKTVFSMSNSNLYIQNPATMSGQTYVFPYDSHPNDSTNAVVGTVTGSVTYVAGQVDNAVNINNATAGTTATNYISYASGFSLNSSAFTISLWINQVSPSGAGALVNVGANSSSDNGVVISMDNSGATLSAYLTTTANAGYANGLLYSIYDGSIETLWGTGWSHVALTYNSSTNNTCLYLNGIMVMSTRAISGTVVGTGYMRVGARIGSQSHAYKGSIDDLRVYNRALTASEIMTQFNRSRSVVCTNNGRLGVGVNDPQASLHVNGSFWLGAGCSASNTVFKTFAGPFIKSSEGWIKISGTSHTILFSEYATGMSLSTPSIRGIGGMIHIFIKNVVEYSTYPATKFVHYVGALYAVKGAGSGITTIVNNVVQDGRVDATLTVSVSVANFADVAVGLGGTSSSSDYWISWMFMGSM